MNCMRFSILGARTGQVEGPLVGVEFEFGPFHLANLGLALSGEEQQLKDWLNGPANLIAG